MKIKDPQILVETITEILAPYRYITVPAVSFFNKVIIEASIKEKPKTKSIIDGITSTKNEKDYQDNDTLKCNEILRELFRHYQLNITDPTQDLLTSTILKFIAEQLEFSRDIRKKFTYTNPDKTTRANLSNIKEKHPILKTLNDTKEKELTELANTCLYFMTDEPKKLLGNIDNLLKDFTNDKSIKALHAEILKTFNDNENKENSALKCIEMYRKLFLHYEKIMRAPNMEKITSIIVKFFHQELNVPLALITAFANDARDCFWNEVLYGETAEVKAQRMRKHPIAIALASLEGKLLNVENQNDNTQTSTEDLNENNSNNHAIRKRYTGPQ